MWREFWALFAWIMTKKVNQWWIFSCCSSKSEATFTLSKLISNIYIVKPLPSWWSHGQRLSSLGLRVTCIALWMCDYWCWSLLVVAEQSGWGLHGCVCAAFSWKPNICMQRLPENILIVSEVSGRLFTTDYVTYLALSSDLNYSFTCVLCSCVQL